MEKIIILAHPEKPEALIVREKIIDKIKTLFFDHFEVVNENAPADLAILLGGDGFVMHGVGKFSPRKIPCLCLNAGDLGFLTSGSMSNWKDILSRDIFNNKYIIEERLGLELTIEGEKFGPFANDVYLRHSASMANFRVALNSGKVVIYDNLPSDGVIVSVPTGSTGYNTAAGGPVIQPGVECLVVTPICSGKFNTPPIVLSPNSKIEIDVLKIRQPGEVSLIGDGKTLKIIDKPISLSVNKHQTKMLFAVLNEGEFYEALKKKKGFM